MLLMLMLTVDMLHIFVETVNLSGFLMSKKLKWKYFVTQCLYCHFLKQIKQY